MNRPTLASAGLFPRQLTANQQAGWRQPGRRGRAARAPARMRDHGEGHTDEQRTHVSAEAEASTGHWADPGLFTVAPGVHRVPLPLPTDALRAVNVYVVEDGDGLVLIDAGWALEVARRQLEAALTALDAGLPDIRRFLITHVHRDHYTQALAIRRDLGTAVALGAGER